MKIIMTLLVRDEEDIIRENIEFHLSQGVDFIIAMDNKSVDATADILKEYEAKGVLKYLYEGNDDYNQHVWVTKMARMAYTEYGADWVINNDADEFWWPIAGEFREVFEKVPDKFNIIKVERNNFILVDDEARSFHQRMIYREKQSLNVTGRPLPPKVAHRGSKTVDVAQGNHSVSGLTNRGTFLAKILPNKGAFLAKILPNKGVFLANMMIMHFPIRSYKQILNKITKGGAAYKRNDTLPTGTGETWRKLYSEYLENYNLQNYYDSESHSSEDICERIASGDLVVDKRLCNYMSELINSVTSVDSI